MYRFIWQLPVPEMETTLSELKRRKDVSGGGMPLKMTEVHLLNVEASEMKTGHQGNFTLALCRRSAGNMRCVKDSVNFFQNCGLPSSTVDRASTASHCRVCREELQRLV